MRKTIYSLIVALAVCTPAFAQQNCGNKDCNKRSNVVQTLGLNDQQAVEFRKIMDESRPKGAKLTKEQREAKKKEADERIQKVLTPEQYAKYKELRNNRNQGNGNKENARKGNFKKGNKKGNNQPCMEKELNLTPEQAVQFRTIMKSCRPEKGEKLDKDEMKVRRDQRDKQLKQLLTEQQYDKFKKLAKKNQKNGKQKNAKNGKKNGKQNKRNNCQSSDCQNGCCKNN